MSTTPKCEPCRVNEIDADATYTIDGEYWCDDCIDFYSGSCFVCGDIFADEDLHHGPQGKDGDPCCYNCGQKDATSN